MTSIKEDPIRITLVQEDPIHITLVQEDSDLSDQEYDSFDDERWSNLGKMWAEANEVKKRCEHQLDTIYAALERHENTSTSRNGMA